MEGGDLPIAPLSYEAGVDDIDAFYASPEPELNDQQLQLPAETSSMNNSTYLPQRPLPVENHLAAPTNIDKLADQAVFNSTIESSADPAFFQVGHPPNPYSPMESGSDTSLMQDSKQITKSPGATQARSASSLGSKRNTKSLYSDNKSETPANRANAISSYPSSDRSQLQAEMRTEEGNGTSPVQDSPPLAKLDLRASTILDQSPLSANRSPNEPLDFENPNALRAATSTLSSQPLKRNRHLSSPLSGDLAQRKKAKVVSQLSLKQSRVLSNAELQQSQSMSPVDTHIVSSGPPLQVSSPYDRQTLTTEYDSSITTGERKAPSPKERAAAKLNNPRKREKGNVKQEIAEPSTSVPAKRPPKHLLSERELKELGGIASNTMKQSPRKTRIQRTIEQESRPNASAAAKRRHSLAPKQ
ncbi:hypothetical protein AC579_1400 [Pseudocercospora musae]|uniref:Uncharacterized protein n=1 Tax=Pseudocercospora musae TaxID=113226 RepID=A0A139IFN3_9PEZI|nr:hypothetical protein AC579_1400 [Pseudocercospora musae]